MNQEEQSGNFHGFVLADPGGALTICGNKAKITYVIRKERMGRRERCQEKRVLQRV